MESIILSCKVKDPALLGKTFAEYSGRVERGEMTEEQAFADALALAVGMIEIHVEPDDATKSRA